MGETPEAPSIARIYDFFLGGDQHRTVDREAAEEALATRPELVGLSKANRAFLGRVVRFLAESGIRQFVDIGAGLPTQDNVHQVAQRIAPQTRVVYIDKDPAAVERGAALVAGSDTVRVLRGDLLDPDVLLADPRLRELIDLDEPVAVLMLAVLHFIPDDDAIRATVRHLVDAVAPGSFLAISCGISEGLGEDSDSLKSVYRGAFTTDLAKSDVLGFFDGVELVEPGLVTLPSWRPDGPVENFGPEELHIVGGVGRKAH
jgi:O-methyltransferase involved in polyketide biosynthesis